MSVCVGRGSRREVVLWTVHATDLGRRAHFDTAGGLEDIQSSRGKELEEMGLEEMSFGSFDGFGIG